MVNFNNEKELGFVLPKWIFSNDKEEIVNNLLDDGLHHSLRELRVIFGSIVDNKCWLNNLLDKCDAIIIHENYVGDYEYIVKKERSIEQQEFGVSVNRTLMLLEENENISYDEFYWKHKIRVPFGYTIHEAINRAKLIRFLRTIDWLKEPIFRSNDIFSKPINDSGKRISYGEEGAMREPSTGKGRFDLITPWGLERLAKWYEFGAMKYADRNWEKGIPFSRCIDSAMRHITKFMMGSVDEDHLSAAVWNLLVIIHFQELERKDLDDLPH